MKLEKQLTVLAMETAAERVERENDRRERAEEALSRFNVRLTLI